MSRAFRICVAAALAATSCAAAQPIAAAARTSTSKPRGRAVHARTSPSVRATITPASRLARVGAANRAASSLPDRGSDGAAVQVYPWSPEALYRLLTAPEQVSDIVLEPGETLVSVAAGDTARWIIGNTTSGAGDDRRTHVLVKPSASGLKTNLVIATDRRVYHVQVESTSTAAMASMSWTYPQDALLALRGVAATSSPAVGLDRLHFDYRIDGAKAPWRPLRAFDDGRQVFIQFPPTLSQSEAPPLFVRGRDGRPQLVNYRIRGHFYVVDNLFDTAELRLGGRHQQMVRIVREEGK